MRKEVKFEDSNIRELLFHETKLNNPVLIYKNSTLGLIYSMQRLEVMEEDYILQAMQTISIRILHIN